MRITMCNQSKCKCKAEPGLLEKKSEPHVHAASMKLYAEDAAETDKPWERWETKTQLGSRWYTFDCHPDWTPGQTYRRKRKMRVVNGFSVPAPETNVPSTGTTVFIADPARDSWYSYTSWCTTPHNQLWFSRNLLFLNKDDAIANAKAMCFIDPDSKPV